MYRGQIQKIHLEISTFCNASCLGCSRTSDMAEGIENPITPNHLSLEFFEDVLNDHEALRLEELLFCGVMGDPLAHPEFLQYIEYAVAAWPNLNIVIHTNGSLGSTLTWQRLGALSKKHSIECVFSIDGLEDTHALYRIGTSWSKIIRNAQTFMEHGGQAVWKYILFDTNIHQLPEAEQLAKSLGFARFTTRKNYDSKRQPTTVSLEDVKKMKTQSRPFADTTEAELGLKINKLYDASTPISCKAQQRNEIYIDSLGEVWPCCWIGNLGERRLSIIEREYFHRHWLKDKSFGFNSLKKYSLQTILQDDFFAKDIPSSWERNENTSQRCSPACIKHCGQV